MPLVNSTYRIDIDEKPDPHELKSIWLELEAKNNKLSFFHSWQWLETWLHIYTPNILLISAKYGEETVALGLFGKSRETRHHIIKSNKISLLQTGNPTEDQIWVEFNDFLCHPDHLEKATSACISALLSHETKYDEIVISMMKESRARSLLDNFNHTHISLSAPVFSTNLKPISDAGKHYLDSLSRNTRYQINRSSKKYESLYGTLQLTFAEDTEQAFQYWEEAGKLHTQRWRDSGFRNPNFVSFHKNFILKNFDTGMVDMAKITAGNHLVAIIYNIKYRNNVYFYLQGLQYEEDSKLKPGLTAHPLLIEHYLQHGMNTYNFMGGYSQYKKQLSQATENLLIITIQKPLLKLRAENFVRSLKQKVL